MAEAVPVGTEPSGAAGVPGAEGPESRGADAGGAEDGTVPWTGAGAFWIVASLAVASAGVAIAIGAIAFPFASKATGAAGATVALASPGAAAICDAAALISVAATEALIIFMSAIALDALGVKSSPPILNCDESDAEAGIPSPCSGLSEAGIGVTSIGAAGAGEVPTFAGSVQGIAWSPACWTKLMSEFWLAWAEASGV